MAKVSKRMRACREGYEEEKLYSLEEAVSLVKSSSKVKFDESVDMAAVLGVDTRQSDQQVRGSTVLPHGTGKTVRVAVFAKGDKAEEAEKAGADIVGAEDLVEAIQGGRLDFDRCLATPDMMALVGRLGKILGPRNMMPNPRLGTVTADIANAVANVKGGAVVYRAEKAGIVHVLVGKVSFSESALVENIRSILDALQAAKPSGVKGTYMKRLSISSTMGSGIKVAL
jgi:large subunit ribosomal protein L1